MVQVLAAGSDGYFYPIAAQLMTAAIATGFIVARETAPQLAADISIQKEYFDLLQENL